MHRGIRFCVCKKYVYGFTVENAAYEIGENGKRFIKFRLRTSAKLQKKVT